MIITNTKIQKILNSYEKIWSLNYLNTLVGWDTETYMPVEGVEPRGKVLSNLNSILQDLFLESSFVKMIKDANNEEGLNVYEKKILHVLNKQLDYFEKLPKKFLEEYTGLLSCASTLWGKSRADNNITEFLPVLEKIFSMTREKAEYLGYDEDPYEAIFKTYEDDFSVNDLDKYFLNLKKFLGKIDLSKLEKKFDVDIKHSTYNKEKMMLLNNDILKFLNVSDKQFRLDVSTHPFSLFLGLNDIRLTTNYSPKDFTAALLPTIHEFGHGLFASQANKELEYTPLWPECSYALHESQSRLWENMISRSKGFINKFYDDFKGLNNDFTELKPDDFYHQFNEIRPTFIRTQADEITYHYHIIIRYEIERDLLNKKLEVKDVAERWNADYQKYLGITPKNFQEGVLQDIHWSFGNIGYFPTYSLGSVLSATWYELMNKDLHLDTNEYYSKDDMIATKEWLRNNLHKYAGTYDLKELALKLSGKEFSTKPWEDYITKKYDLNFDKSLEY